LAHLSLKALHISMFLFEIIDLDHEPFGFSLINTGKALIICSSKIPIKPQTSFYKSFLDYYSGQESFPSS
jgi:hypothetical protein